MFILETGIPGEKPWKYRRDQLLNPNHMKYHTRLGFSDARHNALTAWPPVLCYPEKRNNCVPLQNEFHQVTILRLTKSLEGIVSPPERCDFMSSQKCYNNVILSLFIMFGDLNSNYFNKFI